MPKVLGSLFAVVALGVCILAGIEPWTSTVRGIVAFAVGHVLGAIWESFTGAPGGKELNAEDLLAEVNEPEPEPEEPLQAEVA
ncbi:MAG: hypothetical protein KF824_10230 [Fimbriimonadaceae bacterium]|nr:MAG: hypothetical protein KF824_10230 [Fimbriimonadaceae bacterium]